VLEAPAAVAQCPEEPQLLGEHDMSQCAPAWWCGADGDGASFIE
jgi:hypothetical protein